MIAHAGSISSEQGGSRGNQREGNILGSAILFPKASMGHLP